MKWPSVFLVFMTVACASQSPRATPPLAAPSPAPLERKIGSDSTLNWTTPATGVEVGILNDNELIVIRVDPTLAPLVLLNPPDTTDQTPSAMSDKFKLFMLTNAAMFQADNLTSTGYMKNRGKVIHKGINPKLLGFLAFDPKNRELPSAAIINRDQIPKYKTVIQTLRIWTPEKGVMWKPNHIYWNSEHIGVDAQSRVVFIFHPGAIEMMDLTTQILSLGLDLNALLYLEGGHHAILHLPNGVGPSYSEGLPAPNLIGVTTAP